MELRKLQKDIHAYAKSKGWWNEQRPIGDVMTNIHSEISEAWEEYRAGNAFTFTYYEDTESGRKPCGFPIEMADALIRILDVCEHLGIDLEAAIQEKHEYNLKRPFRHGNKLA